MDPVSRLTEKQKQCLRLVAQNMNSKQIARVLGISEHTVDQRIRQSLRVLDVSDRFQAARMLSGVEAPASYQPLIHQSPTLADADDTAPFDARRKSGFLRQLGHWFPSVGGNRHDLNRLEVIKTIVRFAAVIAGGSAAIVTIGLWLMQLFA